MREGNSNTKVGNFHPTEGNYEPKQEIFDSSEGSLIQREETKRSRRSRRGTSIPWKGSSLYPGESCIPDCIQYFLRGWETVCFSKL
jgi:hypothetical protein